MKKILAYFLFGSLALIGGACASTTQMEPDGQTHWMTRCDEDADCGELSCICGVCTEACTANDECSGGERVATCSSASVVLDTAVCTSRQAAGSVCAPLCERQSDCNDVASGLTCESNGLCAVEDREPIDDDGSVPDEPDAGDSDARVDEVLTPVTGPVTEVELACDEDGNLAGTGPFEIVASGDFGTDALAVSADGTMFGLGVIDSVRNSAFRVVAGNAEPFGSELWEVQQMIIQGDELITGRSDGYEATMVATNVETEARLTLAREEALNVDALVAEEDAVYWIAHLDQEPVSSRIWRSPRVPGESVMLAVMETTSNHLLVLDNYLYFLAGDLFRIAKDGRGGGFVEGLELEHDNAGALCTDGRDLFYTLLTQIDDLGNPIDTELGIVRVDPFTLASETVLEPEEQPWEMIARGAYVYWTTQRGIDDFEPVFELWRGASNGSRGPEHLGTVEAYVSDITEHDGELYWISTCRIGNDGTTKSHIVRTTE